MRNKQLTADAANSKQPAFLVKNKPRRVAGLTTKAKTAASAVITCSKCGHEIQLASAAAVLGARGGRVKVKKGFAVCGQPAKRHKDKDCVI